jgi:hypothetical protein
MGGRDRRAVGDDDGALDHVVELAHIAGPRVVLEDRQGLGIEVKLARSGEVRDERRGHPGDVALARAERRQLDLEDGDAKIEVLAEAAVAHGRREIAVGGGDQAEIGAHFDGAADAVEAPLLDHTEQLGLERGAELADLVEEERASVGLFEAALALRGGAGERALLVAEELRLHQRVGDRGAVDGDEGPRRALAGGVDRARDQLFAGAALAEDEDVDVARGDAIDLAEHGDHRRGSGDDPRVGGALGAALEVLDLHRHAVTLDGVAQRGRELVAIERLGQVVVGAGAHGLDDGGDLAIGGEHHHGEVREARADLLERLEAAHAGEADVEAHRLDEVRRERGEAGLGVVERLDLVARALEPALDQGARVGVVLDEEDEAPWLAGSIGHSAPPGISAWEV